MNKLYFQRIFAALLLYVLVVVTTSEALTCDDCLKANSSLLISCEKNGNTTDLCSNSKEENCTIKATCVAIPSNASAHIASASISPTKSIVPQSSSSHKSNVPSSSMTASASSAKPHPTPSPTPTKKPTTRPPKPSPKPPPHFPRWGRKFDTASFIGGILLCGGVILLVYIAVRCYKAKPDYSRL